jgi:hypothetical protein
MLCFTLCPVSDSEFDVEAYYPVTLYVKAEALFADEESDAEKLFTTMESADYEKFITEYVWNATSTLFFGTKRVYFSSSHENGQIPELSTPSGTEAPQSELTGSPTMTMTNSQSEVGIDTGILDETNGATLPSTQPEVTMTEAANVEITALPEESESPLDTLTGVPASNTTGNTTGAALPIEASTTDTPNVDVTELPEETDAVTDIPTANTSIPTTTDAEISGSTTAPMSDSAAVETDAPGASEPTRVPQVEEPQVPELEVTDVPENSATGSPVAGTNVSSTDSTSGISESNPVMFPASMEFGFFPDVEVKEPTAEEVGALVKQINRFYDDVLGVSYENFQTFEADGELLEAFTILRTLFLHQSSSNRRHPFSGCNQVVNTTFVNETFGINFDGFAFFEEGSNVPFKREVLTVMEGADYMRFIQDYAWNVTRPSPFFDTLSVKFEAFF